MESNMILIGLGSNLCGKEFDSPREVLEAAIAEMLSCGIIVKEQSRFYESEPVPKSDQPWFVNAVVAVETELAAGDLLHKLHEIEAALGRQRRVRWEARVIDLDILSYKDKILPSAKLWGPKTDGTTIPHPRLHERLFVLKPMMDICPDWKHPVLGKTVAELVQIVEKETEQSIIRSMD